MAARSKKQVQAERKRRKQEQKKRKERAKLRSHRQKLEMERRATLADEEPDSDPLLDTDVDVEDDWEETSYDEASYDLEDDWQGDEFHAEDTAMDSEIDDADLDDVGPPLPRPHIQSWWNEFADADDRESIRLARISRFARGAIRGGSFGEDHWMAIGTTVLVLGVVIAMLIGVISLFVRWLS